MRNYIILGPGRFIHKNHIHHALHNPHATIGCGTAAVKRGGRMVLSSPCEYTNSLENVKHHNKQFKPLKFKM